MAILRYIPVLFVAPGGGQYRGRLEKNSHRTGLKSPARQLLYGKSSGFDT